MLVLLSLFACNCCLRVLIVFTSIVAACRKNRPLSVFLSGLCFKPFQSYICSPFPACFVYACKTSLLHAIFPALFSFVAVRRPVTPSPLGRSAWSGWPFPKFFIFYFSFRRHDFSNLHFSVLDIFRFHFFFYEFLFFFFFLGMKKN